MEERHNNRELYFKEQHTTLNKYILPYIEKFKPITENTKVLEVGCGYGGNLKPYMDKGCFITGVDIREKSIEDAKRLLDIDSHPKLKLIASDIYDVEDFDQKFDIIFMKDTLEHIPNQEKFVPILKTFLKDDGIIFQGFPPWCNPFGGHQQMCEGKILSKLPWFHVTPRPVFKAILKLFGEKESTVNGLLIDVYDTRISIFRFKKIVRKSGLEILDENLFFINPNYEVKFKLKPRKLLPVFNIPFLREFYTTTAYYILRKKQ